MQDTEICYMSAVDMAQAIITKELSPLEVINAVVSRSRARIFAFWGLSRLGMLRITYLSRRE